MCVKVEKKKIKDLHQILKNDKDGWFYAKLLKLSNKLHKNKLQKNCRSFLHYFQARARPRYFRCLCQVSACFYRTFWKITHFPVLVCLVVKTSLSAKPFLWKCFSPTSSFSCKSNSFSWQKFCTKTRFETEANQNSEIGYFERKVGYLRLPSFRRLVNSPWSTRKVFLTSLNTVANAFCWPSVHIESTEFDKLITALKTLADVRLWT